MNEQTLETVLRDNPHIDRRPIEQAAELLAELRKGGRPGNVYGISSRLSASELPSDTREKVKLKR
jgi:hypothetical protein